MIKIPTKDFKKMISDLKLTKDQKEIIINVLLKRLDKYEDVALSFRVLDKIVAIESVLKKLNYKFPEEE